MAHLPPIVADLAMILLVAGITTILFKKLNQPLYLVTLLPALLPVPISTFSNCIRHCQYQRLV